MTALLLALTLFTAGEDSLATARNLYASAAYEDALAVLNRITPSPNQPSEETRAVDQYRALCLLALGRAAEAERAIEAVVTGDPAYRPAADVSPRVRTAFSDVRRRILPVLIQKHYAFAKAAFDRREFGLAATSFTQVLQAMTDPDVEAAANQSPLSDLRTLAAGFRDLAETAAAPPPPPPPAPEPVPAAAPAPAAPAAPRVFTASDDGVVPPIVIRQNLPPYPGQIASPRQGLIDVVIDENGLVEAALMTQRITRQYDNLAIAATKTWRYYPARQNGVPVKYRKAVQISIKPKLEN